MESKLSTYNNQLYRRKDSQEIKRRLMLLVDENAYMITFNSFLQGKLSKTVFDQVMKRILSKPGALELHNLLLKSILFNANFSTVAPRPKKNTSAGQGFNFPPNCIRRQRESDDSMAEEELFRYLGPSSSTGSPIASPMPSSIASPIMSPIPSSMASPTPFSIASPIVSQITPSISTSIATPMITTNVSSIPSSIATPIVSPKMLPMLPSIQTSVSPLSLSSQPPESYIGHIKPYETEKIVEYFEKPVDPSIYKKVLRKDKSEDKNYYSDFSYSAIISRIKDKLLEKGITGIDKDVESKLYDIIFSFVTMIIYNLLRIKRFVYISDNEVYNVMPSQNQLENENEPDYIDFPFTLDLLENVPMFSAYVKPNISTKYRELLNRLYQAC